MADKCIFCAIVAKQIPSFAVYEDNDFLAFLDINPLNRGHSLVISKKHHRWTYDISNFGPYWEVAKKIALAQLKGLDAKFVQFVTAGLGVAHAHIHVVPRYENDGHGEYLNPSNVKKFTEQEFKDIVQKIKAAIPADEPAIPRIQRTYKPRIKSKKYSTKQIAAFRRDTEQT